MGLGGAAFLTAGSVAQSLQKDPLHSVSENVIVGTVFLNRSEMRSVWTREADSLATQPGPLASTWSEYEQAAKDRGLVAADALAV